MAEAFACRQLTKGAVHILQSVLTNAELLENIKLILTEATANAVCHAYNDGDLGKVEITMHIHTPEHVELQISDWGKGFAQSPVSPKLSAPEAEDGRGLYIIAKLADTFSVEQHKGKNTLRIQITAKENA